MTGVELLGKILTIIVGGIKTVAGAIGEGLSELATSVAITVTGEGSSATSDISVFLTLVCVFAGIALAIGLSKFVVKWVASLGARK